MANPDKIDISIKKMIIWMVIVFAIIEICIIGSYYIIN